VVGAAGNDMSIQQRCSVKRGGRLAAEGLVRALIVEKGEVAIKPVEQSPIARIALG